MKLKLNSALWSKDKIQIYKSKDNFRWRVYAVNNKIIGASSEGYKNFQDCLRNLIRNSPLMQQVGEFSVLQGNYKGVWRVLSYDRETDFTELEQTSKVPILRTTKK